MIDALSSFGRIAPAGQISTGAGAVQRPVQPAEGSDFGAYLAQAANGAAQSLKAAEETSMAGIEGKASAQKVVEAVLAAEHNLQTAIAIRDKMVNAYTELSRMAI
jgi:flagellar hook-basal body complex protein FliE